MTQLLESVDLKVFEVPVKDIFSDAEFNCRGAIVPIDVVDLARSIEASGLQQPIVIQPYKLDDDPRIKWRIVSGHRRYAAFLILERKTIPAVIKAGLSDLEARRLNLEENLKRLPLNMLQEAKAIQHFKIAGLNQDDVSKDLGISRGWVQVRFYILDLPPEVQQEVAAGFLTQEQIKDIHALPRGQQFEAVKRIKVAKLNGEKLRFKKKRKIHPLTKKPRTREEMFEMQEVIRNVVGNNFGTRSLAWGAGEISTYEFLRDLRDLAQERGVPYEIPAEVMSQVRL